MEAVLRAEKKKRVVDPQVERAMKVHATNPAGNFTWSANPKPVEKEEVEGVKGAFILRNVSDYRQFQQEVLILEKFSIFIFIF